MGTSSGAGESEGELQLNQLVVAQVHHDPILEVPSVEDKETDSLEVENIKKEEAEEVIAMTTGGTTSTNETSEAENNTESYSIAGATISENESFSLASYEDGMPANFNTTQRSSIPSIEAAPFNQEQPMTAAINQEPCAEADIEATNVTTMLP